MKFDHFDAYRRMLASPDDGLVAWWYLGTTLCDVEGEPVFPISQAETVMIYRTETLDAHSFRIHWWEIGYFRDPVTGEIAQAWRNPITGVEGSAPRFFEEGPAYYTVHRAERGVKIDLVQPQALVQGVDAGLTEAWGQVHVLQTERKVRSFPQPDGTLPAPDSPLAAQALTQLSVYARGAELSSRQRWVACTGGYSFQLTTLPAWMGYGDMKGTATVRGRMQKAAFNEQLNPLAWQRLQQILPRCFDGDGIVPNWGSEALA